MPATMRDLQTDARGGVGGSPCDAARRGDGETGAQDFKRQRLADVETSTRCCGRSGLVESKFVGWARAVLRIVVNHARGKSGRVGRSVSRLQSRGYLAVHHLRLAETGGDDDIRPRSFAASA